MLLSPHEFSFFYYLLLCYMLTVNNGLFHLSPQFIFVFTDNNIILQLESFCSLVLEKTSIIYMVDL
jgi:hypothetical protein